MRRPQSLPNWQGGDPRAFRHWLRTGLIVIDDEEQRGVKYNHNHDELGRFASGPGGTAVATTSTTPAATATPPAPKYPAPVRGNANHKRALPYNDVAGIVANNNLSGYPNEIVLAQIYKESRFDPLVQNAGRLQTATGLMQMNKGAVNAVNLHYGTSYTLASMTDPVQNVQAGTLYLKLRGRGSSDPAVALDRYYGRGSVYHLAIVKAAAALKRPGHQSSMQVLTTVLGK